MQLLKAASTAIHGLLPSKQIRTTEECRQRNDRQSYFSLTRQLVSAQFVLADGQLAARLWQEIADREMDLGRVINLLYGCSFPEDDQAMQDADDEYLSLVDPLIYEAVPQSSNTVPSTKAGWVVVKARRRSS